MFEGKKEVTNETVEKLIVLDKRDLERRLNQLSGVVKVGLKNESITALTISKTFRSFADGDE